MSRKMRGPQEPYVVVKLEVTAMVELPEENKYNGQACDDPAVEAALEVTTGGPFHVYLWGLFKAFFEKMKESPLWRIDYSALEEQVAERFRESDTAFCPDCQESGGKEVITEELKRLPCLEVREMTNDELQDMIHEQLDKANVPPQIQNRTIGRASVYRRVVWLVERYNLIVKGLPDCMECRGAKATYGLQIYPQDPERYFCAKCVDAHVPAHASDAKKSDFYTLPWAR